MMSVYILHYVSVPTTLLTRADCYIGLKNARGPWINLYNECVCGKDLFLQESSTCSPRRAQIGTHVFFWNVDGGIKYGEVKKTAHLGDVSFSVSVSVGPVVTLY